MKKNSWMGKLFPVVFPHVFFPISLFTILRLGFSASPSDQEGKWHPSFANDPFCHFWRDFFAFYVFFCTFHAKFVTGKQKARRIRKRETRKCSFKLARSWTSWITRLPKIVPNRFTAIDFSRVFIMLCSQGQQPDETFISTIAHVMSVILNSNDIYTCFTDNFSKYTEINFKNCGSRDRRCFVFLFLSELPDWRSGSRRALFSYSSFARSQKFSQNYFRDFSSLFRLWSNIKLWCEATCEVDELGCVELSRKPASVSLSGNAEKFSSIFQIIFEVFSCQKYSSRAIERTILFSTIRPPYFYSDPHHRHPTNQHLLIFSSPASIRLEYRGELSLLSTSNHQSRCRWLGSTYGVNQTKPGANTDGEGTAVAQQSRHEGLFSTWQSCSGTRRLW